MLTKEGAKFDVLELDERKDGDAIQAALFKMTGRRTVPNGAWLCRLVYCVYVGLVASSWAD